MMTMKMFQRMSSKVRFSLNSLDKPAPQSAGKPSPPKRLTTSPLGSRLTECSRTAAKFYRPSVEVGGNGNINRRARC